MSTSLKQQRPGAHHAMCAGAFSLARGLLAAHAELVAEADEIKDAQGSIVIAVCEQRVVHVGV